MTFKDDDLLSTRSVTRRDPSQRILAGLDGESRWHTAASHRWTIALALVISFALLIGTLLLQAEPAGDFPEGSDLPPIQPGPVMPAVVLAFADRPVVEPLHLFIEPLAAGRAAAMPRSSGSVAKRAKPRRVATSTNDDITVLSVLVEHIDSERRERARRMRAD